MRPERFHAKDIARFLRRHKIASLPELKAVLGTKTDSTVFRKLKELSCRTSYSHRGRYYALHDTPNFDALGLWSFRSVWFSKYGTLLATIAALVHVSTTGYFASELENVVHVGVKAPAHKLISEGRLTREKIAGRYLYVASDSAVRKQQLAARQIHDAAPRHLGIGARARLLPQELKAAIVLFYSLLDEKQRRLFAGIESMKIGHGGDRQIAELLGMDASTVAKGRKELLTQDVEVDRVRRQGAGRQSVQKKRQKSLRQSRRS